MLDMNPEDTFRIGSSRVTLDVVIRAFKGGAEPAEIVRRYDTLQLSDVRSVIEWYLQNREKVDCYLAQRDHDADELERVIRASQPSGLREMLLARRHALRLACHLEDDPPCQESFLFAVS